MGEKGSARVVEDAGILARGSNQGAMRAHNERIVLTILRRHGPMAKAEIARATGLSAQTVSVIMRKLEAEGVLTRDAPVRGKVGQPSVPMRLAAEGAFFLGLKVGRRSVELVLTDFLGQVRNRVIQTHAFPTPEATLQFAVAQIRMILDSLTDQERARVAGVGVGMPFFLWDWARHLGVPEEKMQSWRSVDLQQELAKEVDLPIYLENDATTACGGELVFGPYAGAQDFLYFYLGYFIGGGVVLNGRVFTGRGNAGAVGPILVPNGQGSVCQLLEVASLSVLEARLKDRGLATASMWESPEGWVLDDAVLETWLQRTAAGLAHAIAVSCAVLDFGEVRIDGWLPLSLRDRLVEAVTLAMTRIETTGITVPQVLPGHVGPDARVLGAASLPLSHRFLTENGA